MRKKTLPLAGYMESTPALVASLALCAGAPLAFGENRAYWLGHSSDWNDPTNWSLEHVPAATSDDDAIINILAPHYPIINSASPFLTQPRDIRIGVYEPDAEGRVDHVSGFARTGPGWIYIGHQGGTGTYNLADTSTVGNGITGFGLGAGSLQTVGHFFLGGMYNSTNGTGTFNMNTTGTFRVGNLFQIGSSRVEEDAASSYGEFNLENGTVITDNDWCEIGNGAKAHGIFRMSGGSFTKNGNNPFVIGSNAGQGEAYISGGTLTVPSHEFWVSNTRGNGYLELSGGAINVNSYICTGRNNGTGLVDMSGGTITKTGGGHFIVGAMTSQGTFNQTGGLVQIQAGEAIVGEFGGANGVLNLSEDAEFRTTILRLARDAGSFGTANLSGGTLRVGSLLGAAGTSEANFDGTRIIANRYDTNFISGISNATIEAGGLIIDSDSHALTASQAFNGPGAVTKLGEGRLLLSGSQSYSGGTFAKAGTVALTTKTANTGAVTVSDGANFEVVQQESGGFAESMYVDGNITLGESSGAHITFNLNALSGNPNYAALITYDDLAVNGAVKVNISGNNLRAGTFPLLVFMGNKIGSGTLTLGTLPPGVSAHLQESLGQIDLVIDKVFRPYWTGANGNAWDINNTVNWNDHISSNNSPFLDGSAVWFDDSAANGQVELQTTVSPEQTIVDNRNLSYSFTGSGKISGTGSFVKNGLGSLNMQLTANDYTGATILNSGSPITLAKLANGGQPSSIGASSANPSNLIFGGVSVNFPNTATSTDRGFRLNGSARFNTPADLSFTGPVLDVDGMPSSLTKLGAGTLTLSYPGTNTIAPLPSGTTGLNVIAGTMVFDGAPGRQSVTIGGETWIGSTVNVPAHLVLNNADVKIASWLAAGRGNGDEGVTSTVTITNSTLETGNFSTGFDNGNPTNYSKQIITLTDSTWLDRGLFFLAESKNSDTTMTLAGNSMLTVRAEILMSRNTGTITNFIMKDQSKLVQTRNWLSLGQAQGTATMTLKDNASYDMQANDFNVSDLANSKGTLNIQDSASVHANGIAYIGKGDKTIGIVNMTGGSFTGESWISLARYVGSTGTVTVSNGGLVQTHPERTLIIGEEGTGTLTIAGSGVVTSFGGIRLAPNASAKGILNLESGGVLYTSQIISGGGRPTLNFNGGKLIIIQGNSNVSNMASADVFISPAGAYIDTNGQNAVLEAFFDDSTQGAGPLTKAGTGTLFLNGGQYHTGATIVEGGVLAGDADYVDSALTVKNGAALMAGHEGGELRAPSVTFQTGSTLIADLNHPDALLNVDNLDIQGAALAFQGTPTLREYVIARYTNLTGTFTSIPAFPANYSLTYNYTENGATEIALTREGGPYDDWTDAFISNVDPNADISPTGDPDRDGISNIVEFALNGNPMSGATDTNRSSQVLDNGDGSQFLVLTIPVRNGAVFQGAGELVSNEVDDIAYRIQGSVELGVWNQAVVELQGAEKVAAEAEMPALDEGWTYRSFKLAKPVADASRGFLRVMIEDRTGN